MARYGERYKQRVVARMLPPESTSAEQLSREVGIGADTLERWRKDLQSKPARERVWTAAARLEAVIATAALAQRSAWCREKGIYLKDLEQCERARRQRWHSPRKCGPARKKRVRTSSASRSLSCELQRKEKALAEAAALLILYKKSRGDLPSGRGRMIALEDRRALVDGIEQAHASGARLKPACEIVGITLRTLQRWQAEGGLELGDRRPLTTRQRPSHALSEAEREAILSVANEARFADMPPARIVPTLADEGVYLASESTFARLLRDRGQTRHRGRAKTPRPSRPPTTHVATAPRQGVVLGHDLFAG